MVLLFGVLSRLANRKKFSDELSKQVKIKTLEIEAKNESFVELAFVTSHTLRGKLCTLLSLISLKKMNIEEYDDDFFMTNLEATCKELDEELAKANAVLEETNAE